MSTPDWCGMGRAYVLLGAAVEAPYEGASQLRRGLCLGNTY